MLQSEGLVVHHAHRGTTVAEYSPEDAAEVYGAPPGPGAHGRAARRRARDRRAARRAAPAAHRAGRRRRRLPPLQRGGAQRAVAPRRLQRLRRRATSRSSSRACGRPCRGARSGSRAARRCPSSSTSASPSRSSAAIPTPRSRACASTSRSARPRPSRTCAPSATRGAREHVAARAGGRARAPPGGARGRAGRAAPGAHRGDRRGAERVHHRHRRPGQGGRRGDGRAPQPRRVAGAARRVPDRGEGQHRRRRRAGDARARRFFADRVPDEDAEVVRRLRAAGAIVLGKVALHEFAYGATTDNPHFGACRNPWDTDRVPGGSSGGSGAALGADLCLGALGTDTGGSVRIPAALNGVSALRPTYGLVSARGTFPVSAALDTIGPMARTIADVAEMLAVMAGYDRDDPHAVEHPFDEPRGGLHGRGRRPARRPAAPVLLRGRRPRHRREHAGRRGRARRARGGGRRRRPARRGRRHRDRDDPHPRGGHRPAPRAPRRRTRIASAPTCGGGWSSATR